MLAIDLSDDPLIRYGSALLIVLVAYGIGRIARRLLRQPLTERQTPSFGRVVSKLIGWSITTLGVVIAATLAFPSIKPVDLIAGLGIFSIAIGFAFQDILSNLLAGLLLIVRQPFAQGDQIEVNGLQGTVEGITIRETTMKTFDGKRVIVPNADVYQSALEVQTAFDRRRTNLAIGVGYGDDLDRCERVILEQASETQGVLADPEPQAYLVELGDSAVVFDLRYWTEPEQATVRRVQHDVLKNVKKRLDAEGIDIPFPIRTLDAAPSLAALLRNGADQHVDSGDDLSDLTKDELYEVAQDVDLEGRSSMTRDELEDALNNG